MRAYQQVIERVEEQILAGTLRVGDRLPAERDLAAQLAVSRSAVREAMRTLEAQGVVRSGVGSGEHAGTVVSALPSAALTRLLRLHVALNNFAMDDVVAARVMLERSSAALAAGHASPDALAAVASPLAGMAGEVGREDFNDLDTAFHIAIAEAGGNRLVADMTIAIREAMRVPILRELEQLGERWPAVRTQLSAEHRAIHDAIAAGDEGAAGDLMAAHIHSSRRLLAPGGPVEQ